MLGNPLAKVCMHDTEQKSVKNMGGKNGFRDFATLQQSSMEGSTAASKLESEVEHEDYVQQGSCKVADANLAT